MERTEHTAADKPKRRPDTTVGVFVEPACLRVAAISGHQIKAWQSFPLADKKTLGGSEFTTLLKQAVKTVCPDTSDARIWACVSSPDIRVQHVTTPRVHSKQLANAVYWAVTRSTSIETAETVIDFDVETEIVEDGQRKLAVTACVVPRAFISRMEDTFRSASLHLEGLTASIFAFRNLIDSPWLACRDETVCHVNIGDSASQISVFSNGKTILTREIKTGMHAFAEAVARSGKDETQIMDSLPHSLATDGNNVIEAVEPALTRLIRQIEQTMASSTLREMGTHVSRVLISGDVTNYGWIVEYLQEQLNVPIEMMNAFSSKNGASAGTVPETEAEAVSLSPVIGLALSDPIHTPNFLWTYEEKAAHAQSQKYNKAILGVTIVLMLALLGASRLSDSLATKRREDLTALRKELAERGQGLNKAMLEDMFSKASAQQATAVRIAKRHLGTALIRELSTLTPSHVSLDTIRIEMPFQEVDRAGRRNSAVVTLEGRVSSEPGSQESRLAEYSIRLADSPLIQKADLTRTTGRSDEDRNRLPFQLTLTSIDLPVPTSGQATSERKAP